MKRVLRVLAVVCVFAHICAYAVDFDTTIDKEIRQKYNIEEINDANSEHIQLPKLPQVEGSEYSDEIIPIEKPAKTLNMPYFSDTYTGAVNKVKSGTRFLLANDYTITDRSSVGGHVTFSTLQDVNTSSVSIPQGTVFRGRIVNAHGPQISGNGGLIIIDIDEMIYNGMVYKISSTIVKINDRHVFLGKTKGKRSYWKNVGKSCKFGVNANRKMKRISNKIWRVPIVGVVGIVPRAIGVATLGANAMVSPVIGVFKKGTSVSIPRGSLFEIKLTSDVKLKA